MKNRACIIAFKAYGIVVGANPNGDPTTDGRPRQKSDGTGYIENVCIRRKFRNRWQDMGRTILVQQEDHINDGYPTVMEALEGNEKIKAALDEFKGASKDDKHKKKKKFLSTACSEYEDVRLFGQPFTIKNEDSTNVRGAVTISQAESIGPVDVIDDQITKCISFKPDSKSDTMGHRCYVDFGIYEIKGAFNPIMMDHNGVTESDIADVKEALRTLFLNDESSVRPAGSMYIYKLFWCEQENNDIVYSPKIMLDSIKAVPKTDHVKSLDDIEIKVTPLEGVNVEEIDGI